MAPSAREGVELAAASSFAASDRFNLLLLEDGEYYFRDHACYYWREHRRVAGHLKVCSLSLYFVPRDIQEPVFRVPYKSVNGIEELEDGSLTSGEGSFLVAATERVDMKAGDVHRPYQRHKGQFEFRFSLVYTSLEEVLPAVEELCILAQQDGGKAERQAAKERLDHIIQDHEASERFNPGWLEDDSERVVLEAVGNCITALCTQPGRVVLTQFRIYFQPFNVVSNAPIQTYQLDKVMAVQRRVYQLEDLGVEVFFPGRASLYLTLKTSAERDAFIKALMQQPSLQLEHMRSRDRWTRDWVNGRVSNFDYLMYLNREAGRSFKDLTQYPVFPWVIADYTSRTLDLTDPATFRDLTRPIGALNSERLRAFRERYVELKKLGTASPGGGSKEASLSLDFPPPFMYGCHYSTPGYVVFYLMRSDPQLMLRLQNGRFDAPDRLFWSIQDTWKSVLSLPTDVKELIPEFYSNDASFLVNNNDIDFGTRSNGQRVGDVVLPPWASDAQDFVYKLAEALECPYVSERLHKWINLVFGYKSRGPRAEVADNVFHYLTYDEIAIKYLEQEKDPVMREALRLQMMEFGRTPRQLFTKRHPKRRAGLAPQGLLACLACAPTQMRRPSQPANVLPGKGWAGRSITPVSRAVFKLTSRKQARRAATLAWLEQTAATHEPGVLALKQGKGAELVLLVKHVRDAREGKNPHATGEEMTSILVRACKALAVAPQNRRFILDAGALDLLVDALCAGQGELSLQALQALGEVCKEEDSRLASLDRRALAKVLAYLQHPAGPSSEPVLAALTLAASLARATPNRAYFTDHGLLGMLLPILRSLSQLPGTACHSPEPGSPVVLPAPGTASLAAAADSRLDSTAPLRPASPSAPSTSSLVVRRATTLRAHTPRGAQDAQRSAALRQCALVVAALLQDDAQKDLLLSSRAGGASSAGEDGSLARSSLDGRESGGGGRGGPEDGGGGSDGVDLVLALCRSSEPALVQGAAFECLAALTMYDPARQLIQERHLLPMLLQAATSGPAPVQRPAAAAVANVCADPQLAAGALPDQGGLAALVAMALSPDQEVQRHAARALWHLVALPDTRAKAVRAGALGALLSLARTSRRGVQASTLARQALRVCQDDPGTRPQLEAAAAIAGVDVEELASFTAPSHGRVSSHPSASNLPSAASPHGGSTSSLHMATHRRLPSDLRSAGGADTDADTPTYSPGASRWTSFTGGGFGERQGSLHRSSVGEEAAGTPRLGAPAAQPRMSPRRSSPLAAGAGQAAVLAGEGAAGTAPALDGTQASDTAGATAAAAAKGGPAAAGSSERPLPPAAGDGAASMAAASMATTHGSLSSCLPQPDASSKRSSLNLLEPALTLSTSGLPARVALAAAPANGAYGPGQLGQQAEQQQQQPVGCEARSSNGLHARAPPASLDLALAQEGRGSPTPLPLISPVAQPASSAGSSPRASLAAQQLQQPQQQGEGSAGSAASSPRRPRPHRQPSGKVADAVKKLERLASHAPRIGEEEGQQQQQQQQGPGG